MHTRGLVLSLLALVVVASGCVDSQDAISVAESNSEVQNFLEENPNPTVQKTFLNASSGSSPVLDGSQFSQRCESINGGEDHYRVDFIAENENLSTWVEADSKEFVCSAKNFKKQSEEKNLPKPYIRAYDFSNSLDIPVFENVEQTREGNITFDILNDGEAGQVLLKLRIVDEDKYILNRYNRTFRMIEDGRERITVDLTAPPGSQGLNYSIGAVGGNDFSSTYTVLGGSGRSERLDK